jgi:CubicO group peptidase (beta-lactamase class C family)
METIKNLLVQIIFGVIAVVMFSVNCIYPQIENDLNTIQEDSLRALKYINILNSGNRQAVLEYIKTEFDSSFMQKMPVDLQADFQMGFYYMSAGKGYDFKKILASGENEVKALLLNRLTGAWIELRLPVNGSSNKKINNFIEFKAVSSPYQNKNIKKFNDAEIVKKLNKCLKFLVKDDKFSGAIMFAKNGKPLFKEAYGMANKSDQIPNKIDTKFNIASVGKIFTAVAVAQLVEKGELFFTDSLSKYLPADWLNPEISAKIQIRHLLTHTSGLGDYFGKLYGQCEKMVFSDLGDYKSLVSDQTLNFEPGTQWSYSNTGMLLLGVVIEKITGMNYFQYLNKYIFSPSNMKNTGDFAKNRTVQNRALGYYKEYSNGQFEWTNNSVTRVLKGNPSGGCYSTVEDLLNFDIAFRSHRLLNSEYNKIVLSPKPEISSPFEGYGFFLSQSDAGLIARHSGDGTGISCQFSMYLDSGYTVIVLSNYSRPAADIVESVIYQLIISK